jgi:hypothetical protein
MSNGGVPLRCEESQLLECPAVQMRFIKTNTIKAKVILSKERIVDG